MEFKELNLAEVEALSDVVGEAEHGLFNPAESSHHVWARDMALRRIGRGTIFWAGLVDGMAVGIVGLLVDRQPNGKWREFVQLELIGVKQDQRKQGCGSLLLRHAETVAVSLGVKILEVTTTMSTAPFYQYNGFVVDAKRRFCDVVHLYKDLRTQKADRPTTA